MPRDRRSNRSTHRRRRAQRLRKALAAAEGKIERLYGALAEGTVKDTDLFRKSLSRLEDERYETDPPSSVNRLEADTRLSAGERGDLTQLGRYVRCRIGG